ncbi:MAG: nucleotidyltransferase family protein [Enhydrobacter sp.]
MPPSQAYPEFELLCLAVRPHRDDKRIREALHQKIDYARLLALVEGHRVRPALVEGFSGHSWDDCPREFRSSLDEFSRLHLVRMLTVASELRHVAQLFSSGGVRFASFKGPTLALSLYGNLAAREFGDIDIIVPERQLALAESLLISAGYFNGQGDRAFRQAFLRQQRQYAFSRDGAASDIDLHWSFSADPLPFPLEALRIWPNLISLDLGGQRIPILADEDLALLLAGHGTKEEWRSLGWVCDFATLAERRPELDWSRIYARASRQGSGISVLLAWAMVEELLEMPIPRALADSIGQSRQVGRLAARLVERLRTTFPDQVERLPLEDGALCDRSFDRLRAGLKVALTPTAGDYDAWPLPPALWPLYRVTRPVRLAAGLVMRTLRH